jgi:hypothetical protein
MQLVQSAQYSTASRIASRPLGRWPLADATLMLGSLLAAFYRRFLSQSPAVVSITGVLSLASIRT